MNPTEVSLLDLLRRRRELPLLEVVRLCGDLPKLIDERPRAESTPLYLDSVLVDLARDPVELQRLLGFPVTEWPDFTVRFAPQEEESIEQTFASTLPEGTGAHGTSGLARLLYELLGGTQRTLAAKRRPPPLPALNEEGNVALRGALAGEADRETCVSFWQRWLRACEVDARPTGWRIPRWLLTVAQPGTVLYLAPEEEAAMEIALVARPAFRIGRSRSTSDYPTRLLNRAGQLDEERTVQVSRVQVLGESAPTGLTLRDGNGQKPSANGSLWNSAPLPWDKPVPLTGQGELALGGVYWLAVTVQPPRGARGPEIENLAEWGGSVLPPPSLPLDFGAVVFRPQDSQKPTRDAIWLGRNIGFSLARDGGLGWDSAAARSPGQFFYAHGCFWLANSALEQVPPRVNEAVLTPGQIAPLAGDQAVEIGGRRYKVTVEA